MFEKLIPIRKNSFGIWSKDFILQNMIKKTSEVLLLDLINLGS